jgi:hypothetical protein
MLGAWKSMPELPMDIETVVEDIEYAAVVEQQKQN